MGFRSTYETPRRLGNRLIEERQIVRIKQTGGAGLRRGIQSRGYRGVGALFTPDALVYGVLGWGELEKVKPVWQEIMRCFNINLQMESMIAEGDMVAVRYTERGKSMRPFRGSPATGRSYEVVAMEWFMMRDGLIHHRWGARDSTAEFRQMGLPLN